VTSVPGRVRCHVCGSLFDTSAPDCPRYDKNDPAQIRTCDIGEACLYYSWQKAENDYAVIRECFSTSILLGSLDNPVLPSSSCSPEPVESDVITACLCTSDMCNDLSSDSEPRGIIPETRVTTLPPRVTQDSRRERTFSPSRNPFNQFTTESFRSVTSPTSSPAVISVPSRNTNRRILCYKCGSLFSRDGNDRCTEFDESDPSQQGFCQPDEVCLMYTWQKSRSRTGIVRECLSRSVLIGPVQSPLTVTSTCNPRDISESSLSRVNGCLCDTDLCNGYVGADRNLPSPSRQIGTTRSPIRTTKTTTQKSRELPETPRRGSSGSKNSNRSLKNVDNGRPGLQCYSCGSLLNPDKECDKFDATNSTQSQTCLKGEACLMYTWSKSSSQKATLRECFPTRVLLGSIQNPLTPQDFCVTRDITDDGSGSIQACLCSTDYCNDVQPVRGAIENEIFDSDRNIKSIFSSTIAPFKPQSRTTTTRTTTTRIFTQRTTTVAPRICPSEFEQVQNNCFYMSDRRVGWIEAKKQCEARKAHLVSFEFVSKQADILKWVGEKTRRRRGKFWTGGNDIQVEGVWEWEGAGGIVPDFGWTQLGLEQSLEENCLSWSASFGFNIGDSDASWQGASCCNNLRFICQV